MAGDEMRAQALELMARAAQAETQLYLPKDARALWVELPDFQRKDFLAEQSAALTALLALLDERGFVAVSKVATNAEIDAAYEATKAAKFVKLRQDINVHTLRMMIRETRAAMISRAASLAETMDG